MGEPLGYLITFRTYGTWLHGDDRGSVDRHHNVYGTPLCGPNAALMLAERTRLRHAAVLLDKTHRANVGDAIRRLCTQRDWALSALNVRTNHVHAVIAPPDTPERVLHALKSFATRHLRERALVSRDLRLWARHGGTRYLWTPKDVQEACRYVAESQGDDLDGAL